jgi:hypothetical protein
MSTYPPFAIPSLIPADTNFRTTRVSTIYPTQTLGPYTTWKLPVRVATTANITLSGLPTIDGITVKQGDRVLVKNQITTSENGIYVVFSSAAATDSWLRANDLPTGSNAADMVVFVNEGTANANIMFICTNTIGTDIVGSDSLVYTDYGTSGGGGGVPGGNNTDIQYNNAGAFGGSDIFTFSPTLVPASPTFPLDVTGLVKLGTTTPGQASRITAPDASNGSGLAGGTIVFSGGDGDAANGGNAIIVGGYSATNEGGSCQLTGGRSGSGDGGSSTVIGGDSTSGDGGSCLLLGGDGNNGGDIRISGGEGLGNIGGEVQIFGGRGLNVAGNITLETGNTLNGPSGLLIIKTADKPFDAHQSGQIFINSGTTSTVPSGNVWFNSGDSTTGDTGAVRVGSGICDNANTGNVFLFSGVCTTSGTTGAVDIRSGTSSGNTGNMEIVTGASSAADSGSINIRSGNSAGTSGVINLTAGIGATQDGYISLVTSGIPVYFRYGGAIFTKDTGIGMTIVDLAVPPTVTTTSRQGIITITDPSALANGSSITITVNDVNVQANDSVYVNVQEFDTAGNGIPMVLVSSITASTSFTIQLYNIGAAAFSASPMKISFIMM